MSMVQNVPSPQQRYCSLMMIDQILESPVEIQSDSLPNHIRDVFAKSTCLYSKEAVEAALDKMAIEIHDVVAHSNPLFICVVVGGIVVLGNLLPRLDFPLEVDYIHATRYQNKTVGAELKWKMVPQTSLKNRTIVIVDDILDGGVTL